jgi:hypothetical protein
VGSLPGHEAAGYRLPPAPVPLAEVGAPGNSPLGRSLSNVATTTQGMMAMRSIIMDCISPRGMAARVLLKAWKSMATNTPRVRLYSHT